MKRARKFALVDKPITPTGSARDALTDTRTRAERLADAIAYLGEKHCLHPKFKKDRLRTGFLQQWRINRYTV